MDGSVEVERGRWRIARNVALRASRSLVRGIGRGVVVAVIGLAALWTLLAFWLWPSWPPWLSTSLAAAWLVAVTVAIARLSFRHGAAAIIAGTATVALAWTVVRPSNDRDWTPDQDRSPRARFAGDFVEIENVRLASYRTADDFDVSWESRRYDLTRLRSVDYVVEPFASWRGPAHTFLSFGFEGGEYLAISAEIRKERGESYSPLQGLFKQYEIAYVAGDERDLIGLRANVRGNPVYVFPLRVKPEDARILLAAMLERANALHAKPEFYNTLTNTCTTNIVRHLEAISGETLPLDVRILLPGYSDELAFELGLIDFDGTLAEAREAFRINERSAFGEDAEGWSRRIRERGRRRGER